MNSKEKTSYEAPCLTLVEIELEQGFTVVSGGSHEGFTDEDGGHQGFTDSEIGYQGFTFFDN